MEAKEGLETTQNSQNDISTSPPTQDSQAGMKSNETMDRKAVKEPTVSAQFSTATTNAQLSVGKASEGEKVTAAAPSDEKSDDNTAPQNSAHDSKDKAPSDAEIPAADAGNDKDTVEKTQQSQHDSAGSRNGPKPSVDASVSKPAAAKPLTVDTKSPATPAPFASTGSFNRTTTSQSDMKPPPAAPLSVPAAAKASVHKTTPFQSEMKPAAIDANAPVDKPPAAAPLPVLTATTTPKPAPQMQQMVTRGFGPSPEDELALLRAPLVETYGPYIYATDTSLSDARQRLRTALEQTRRLREAFTERVYDKYRIILRPVPKSMDAIVEPIIADPIAAHRKLYERMQDIGEEKALEKKEGQRLSAAKAPVGLDGVPLPNAAASAAETAEQIQFLSSGLSLVILPEEEVDERQIDLSRYKYRGPINPETGQKVVGLSAATAAAAESMLDRVRKGAVLRIERQRRRQLQLLSGESLETDTSYTSSMHLLSAGGARQVQKRTAKGQPGNKMRLPYPSSGGIKTSRSRISAALSGSNLLTLNPISEELKPEGKRSAATAALVANGVGLQRTILQRWQHPHPESVGGRRALSAATGQKLPEYVPQSLPPLPLLNMKRKPAKVLNDPRHGTARAKKAVRSVLEQFVDTKELLAAAESIGPEASASNKRTGISGEEETISYDSQNKRRKCGATEIGLKRSLQYAPEQRAKPPTETAVSKTSDGKKQEESDGASVKTAEGEEETASANPDEPPLPPALAFSVMHALGLVRESAREKKNSFRNMSSLLDFTALADKATSNDTSSGDKRKTTATESAMQLLSKKISSRKRSFTYAFLSNTVRETSDDSSVEVIVAEKREETAPVDEHAKKKSKRVSQDEERGREAEDEAESNECPILSIRGGGEDIQDEPDDQIRPQRKGRKRTRNSSRDGWTGTDSPRKSKSPDASASQPRIGSPMSPSAHEASLHSQAMLAELNQHPLTALQSHRPASASDALYAGYSSSPLPGDRGGTLRRQHASIHGTPPRSVQLAHGGYGMSRFPSSPGRHVAGDLAADYYGLQHGSAPGYGNHTDWTSIGAPSASTTGYLQPMGLAGHRAAMVEMSVRERTRALLAREQQQHAAVAAHAAAAQRHANITELSQAAALMSASSGHGAPDFYGHSAGPVSRYTNLSRAQSAPAPLYHGGLEGVTVSRSSKSRKRTGKSSSGSSPSRSSSKAQERDNDGIDAIDANPSFKKRNNPGESNEDAPRDKPKANGEASESESDKCNAEVKASAADRKYGNPHKNTPSPVDQDFLPPPTKPKTNSTSRLFGGDGPSPMPMTTSGMQFIVPEAPSGMSSSTRDLILTGCFYSAIDDDEASPVEERVLVKYLLAVGTAVPIPKAIIANPLKERLNTPGFKSQSKDSAPPIPREVVIAVILVWLWAQHKESFQRAFVKSGRIDVDPECKWLIQTAVEAAVRALMLDIADTVARGGSMAMAFGGGRKGTSNGLKSESHTSTKESDRQGSSSASVEVHVARIVSQGLMGEFCIDDSVDAALPCFHDLVEYLDEARNCALRTKSRERALLAALVARSATTSEQFSHAYTSAMARAGLALGHEDLFEHVQDSDLMTSTMLPYDVFTDESGAWEDSCRPEGDFTPNLKGDELFGRAHARAMIQKSLWTLQDRLNITGGTLAPGPYTDEPPDASVDVTMRPSVQRTPSSSSLRRRSSFSIASESSFDQTSGTAVATSSALYNPRHYSAPLFFDADDIENKPYGKHIKGYRERSFSFKTSLSFSGSADETDSRGRSRKRQKLIRTNSISISPRRSEDESASLPRSTEEIDWVDVAEIFQPVALGPSTPTSRQGVEDGGTSDKTTIIAPYCRKVATPPASDDEGDEEEEDVSDESILARHKVVLDRMKVKIDKVMEARKQTQKQQGFQRGVNPRGRGRGRGRGR